MGAQKYGRRPDVQETVLPSIKKPAAIAAGFLIQPALIL
jgi:hypothetical protein